jgi:hypothetical protein
VSPASLWFVEELKCMCRSCMICLYNTGCWSWTSYFQNCVSGNGNYSSVTLFYFLFFVISSFDVSLLDWPS